MTGVLILAQSMKLSGGPIRTIDSLSDTRRHAILCMATLILFQTEIEIVMMMYSLFYSLQ